MTAEHAVESRLESLRQVLMQQGLDGMIVPRQGEFPGRIVAPHEERLSWLSGFTGSSGVAVVMVEKAALFIDGRYTLQAHQEVDGSAWNFLHLLRDDYKAWSAAQLPAGGKLGFDPRLHTPDWVAETRALVEKAGGQLVSLTHNPIDALWRDRPSSPCAPVFLHPLSLAGVSSAKKRLQLSEQLRAQGLYAALLTSPESIAWLLNIRGNDDVRTPIVLSVALAYASGHVDWFFEPRALDQDIETALGTEVRCRPWSELRDALRVLAKQEGLVGIDHSSSRQWMLDQIGPERAQNLKDPCLLRRARKNEVEQQGSRRAHLQDAVAWTTLLYWLEQEAPKGELHEADVARKMTSLRAQWPSFWGESFATIAGAGANGAIVHYHAPEEGGAALKVGELFLLDSGGQYHEGTTDATRTVMIGAEVAISDAVQTHYTKVLQAHIAMATLRFPHGTTGGQIDTVARSVLWNAGLDYDHGTGHGVGSFLCVHEGPQRISPGSDVPLEAGMICSDEPGCYLAGKYGIRLENLVLLQPADTELADGRASLQWETLSLIPFSRRLIANSLLQKKERAWLDAYHERVWQEVSPLLQEEPVRQWLWAATRPLGEV